MARPRIDEEQRSRAYFWWKRQPATIGMIHTALKSVYGNNAAGRSTVGRWVKEFSEGTTADPQDQPFEWFRMAEVGIPDEAGEFLLNVESKLGDFGDAPVQVHGGAPRFSFRDAKWCWRVYLAVGRRVRTPWSVDEDFVDVEPLSWQNFVQVFRFFSMVEEGQQMAGLGLLTAAVEEVLAYRPWESEAAHARFEAASAAGITRGRGAADVLITMTGWLFEKARKGRDDATT